MTENEALYILNNYKFDMRQNGAFDMITTISVVTNALKELQRYREIGTVEECRKAVEKQRAKKPEVIDQDFDYYKCPVCGEYIWATDNINDHKYCLNCGQSVTL